MVEGPHVLRGPYGEEAAVVVVRKVKRITVGLIALFLSLVGAILPVVPGWPFFILAVLLLSRDIRRLRPWRVKLEKRFPRLTRKVHHWEERFGLCDEDPLQPCSSMETQEAARHPSTWEAHECREEPVHK